MLTVMVFCHTFSLTLYLALLLKGVIVNAAYETCVQLVFFDFVLDEKDNAMPNSLLIT